MHRLKIIKQPGGAVLKEHILTESQRKMVHNYLKQFSKCQKQDYEISDEPMDTKIASLISLGYEKSNSNSNFSGTGLNDSFEIRLPTINVQSAEKDELENDGRSSPLVEEVRPFSTPTTDKKNATLKSKFEIITKIEPPKVPKTVDIHIVKHSPQFKTNINSEESKEDKTSASETLVKEIDLDGEEIKFDSFDLLERLGKGNFGEVFKVILKKDKCKENPCLYALKAMKKSKIIGNHQLKYVVSELNIMKQLHNPFVVTLNYAFQTPKYLYIVMEY